MKWGLLKVHWDWNYFVYDKSRLFLVTIFSIGTYEY